MDTIKTYINNIFKGLPKTSEINKIKEDLLSSMVDKYNELTYEGKSKDEAVGIVIAEFGDIDEIMNEFGIENNKLRHTEREIIKTPLRDEEVYGFLNTTKHSAFKIALGVFLCIMGAAILLLINLFIDEGIVSVPGAFIDVIGIIQLLVLVAVAVALFINSGMKDEEYEYIKKQEVLLPGVLKEEISRKNDSFKPVHRFKVILSISMLILSVISVLITSNMGDEASEYGVVGMLVIVSVAVFILIRVSIISDSYKYLLNQEKETK